MSFLKPLVDDAEGSVYARGRSAATPGVPLDCDIHTVLVFRSFPEPDENRRPKLAKL